MRKLRIFRTIAKIGNGAKKKTNAQLGLAIFAKIVNFVKNSKNRRTLKSYRTLVPDKSRDFYAHRKNRKWSKEEDKSPTRNFCDFCENCEKSQFSQQSLKSQRSCNTSLLAEVSFLFAFAGPTSTEKRPLPWVEIHFDPTAVHPAHTYIVIPLLLSKPTQHDVSREGIVAK